MRRTMKQKKIVMILGSMNRGGAERVISILSHDYAEKGWNVELVLLLFNRVDYILHPNVRIIDMTCGEGYSRMKRIPRWLYGIRKYIRKNKPDIVLAFAARINLLTQIACIGLKQRIFISERNDPNCDGRSKLINIATNIFYPKAAGCIFQTERASGYFPKLKNKKIIANPIMVAEFASVNKLCRIVTVGRLTAQKNQKMLIRAFSKISDKYPMHTLDIYGDGELLEELKKCARENFVANKVLFHGNVIDVHKQIANAELFVLSSDYEGLSNALLEAMMMGLPCISTNCAGSDEYIRDGENGILIPVGDEKALIIALDKMLSDDKLRIRCAEQAKKDSVIFSEKIILQKWHELMDY